MRAELVDAGRVSLCKNILMNTYWKYKTTVFEVEKFEIQELNIWDFEWIYTNKNTNVKGPS